MKDAESKPLSPIIFIPFLVFIFIRPFFSGMAYPVFEFYYEISIILTAIITLSHKNLHKSPLAAYEVNYVYPILLLLSAYIISTATSINIHNSIKELMKFLSYLCAFFIVSQADSAQKNTLIKTIIIAATIISVYSIYQYFWGYQHTIDYLKKTNSDFLINSPYARDILLQKRAIGTFPSPNILAGYLITVFFLACYAASRSGFNLVSFPIIAIIFAVIFTKSIGAWLSIIFTFIASFFIFRDNIKKYRLIVALYLIFIVFSAAFIVSSRWSRLMNLENPHNPIIQRLNYWRISIAAIKDHPFLGIGPGNFQEVFLKYKAGWSIDTRYSHNIFLQTWIETGMLGLIAMVFLITAFIRKSFLKSKYLFLAVSVFIFHNLIDITYYIPETGLFWWIILGLAAL